MDVAESDSRHIQAVIQAFSFASALPAGTVFEVAERLRSATTPAPAMARPASSASDISARVFHRPPPEGLNVMVDSVSNLAVRSLMKGSIPHFSSLTRAGHAAVAVGNFLYVFGGWSQEHDNAFPSK